MLPLISHPAYSYEFSSRHRFPMEKFGLLSDLLKREGIIRNGNLFRPGRAKLSLLAAAHCPDYLQRFNDNTLSTKELRRLGLPWSEGLLKRSFISPVGTLLAGQLALKHGIACHLAGGTHHAHYDFGSGFCVINDLAVAAINLHKSGLAKRTLIFDCDVHQGDGTAAILSNTEDIFTCSLHCEKNFPARKSHSDLDVGLPKGMTDADYLQTMAETLNSVLDQHQPDLVFYDAGVDIFQDDPLGLLDISYDGIAERDYTVLKECQTRGVPVATVIGGGYDDNRQALADRHALVVRAAQQLWA